MTQPTPEGRPSDDRQFVRDVARQLDRRRMRRRLTLWTALLVLAVAAALYLRLGGGGLGLGSGLGLDGDEVPGPTAGPQRCAIRVSGAGIAVAGRAMSRDEAVAACKAMAGADVVVTGDARHGDPEELLRALQAAGIKDIAVQDPATRPADHRAPRRATDGTRGP